MENERAILGKNPVFRHHVASATRRNAGSGSSTRGAVDRRATLEKPLLARAFAGPVPPYLWVGLAEAADVVVRQLLRVGENLLVYADASADSDAVDAVVAAG